MATNFDEMILEMEREVAELKAVSRRVSENLGTITKSTTINLTIKGGKTSLNRNITVPVNKVFVKINTDGEANISCLQFVTPRNGRLFEYSTFCADNFGYNYAFYLEGNSADVTELAGDSSKTKTIQLTIQVTSTSDFEFVITSEAYS